MAEMLKMANLPIWVMQQPKLQFSSKLLLARFVVVSEQGSKVFPVFLEDYAKTFGMSIATVSRSLKQLCDLGFLKNEPKSSWDLRRSYSLTNKVFSEQPQE